MSKYVHLLAAAVTSAAMFGCSHGQSSYSSNDDMSNQNASKSSVSSSNDASSHDSGYSSKEQGYNFSNKPSEGSTGSSNATGTPAANNSSADAMQSRTGSPAPGASAGDTNQGQAHSGDDMTSNSDNMNMNVGPANLNDQDKTFVTEAASGGMFEVQSSKLAQQSATSADLKKFAQHMIDDHTKVNKHLMGLATKKGLTPSTTLSSKDQQTLDQLQKASGADFDKQFAQDQIQAHQDAISAFQQEADSGQDADMKAFAAKNLPTLKGHLKMIQDWQGNMANDR